MSDWSEFNFGREGIGPSAQGQYLSDLGGLFGDAFSRGAEGRSIVGYFGSAMLGGGMGAEGAGAEGASAGGFEGLGTFAQKAGGLLGQGGAFGDLFGGGRGGGNQSPQPTFYNPFSPQPPQPQPIAQTHFQNNSFTPWLQNVSNMQRPRTIQPLAPMFKPGTGYF